MVPDRGDDGAMMMLARSLGKHLAWGQWHLTKISDTRFLTRSMSITTGADNWLGDCEGTVQDECDRKDARNDEERHSQTQQVKQCDEDRRDRV